VQVGKVIEDRQRDAQTARPGRGGLAWGRGIGVRHRHSYRTFPSGTVVRYGTTESSGGLPLADYRWGCSSSAPTALCSPGSTGRRIEARFGIASAFSKEGSGDGPASQAAESLSAPGKATTFRPGPRLAARRFAQSMVKRALTRVFISRNCVYVRLISAQIRPASCPNR